MKRRLKVGCATALLRRPNADARLSCRPILCPSRLKRGKGHCYQGKSQKKCVDCSPSTIKDARSEIDIWCDNTKKTCSECRKDELWDEEFKTSIDAFRKCINARTIENKQCWDGGNPEHEEVVRNNERGKKNCEDLLSDCKSKGLVFTCSESSWGSRRAEVDKWCEGGRDLTCKGWSKDDTKIDCRAVEESMKAAESCKGSLDSMKSSCLDRFSDKRERQRETAVRGYDACKDILDYKRGKSLCL